MCVGPAFPFVFGVVPSLGPAKREQFCSPPVPQWRPRFTSLALTVLEMDMFYTITGIRLLQRQRNACRYFYGHLRDTSINYIRHSVNKMIP